jgi:hypothetical protein
MHLEKDENMGYLPVAPRVQAEGILDELKGDEKDG